MENKTRNFYFELCKVDSNDLLDMIKVRINEDFMSPFKEFIDNTYYSYTGNNIKHQLYNAYPEIIQAFEQKLGIDILNDDNIEVNMVGQLEYCLYNKEYDNQLKFADYIISEKEKIDKQTSITTDILYAAGFKLIEQETNLYRQFLEKNAEYHDIYDNTNPEEYVFLRKLTEDENPIKLDIDNRATNRGTEWHLHIDSSDCCTIGSADIDTVWEFNTLMEVFGSKFRL